MEITSKKRKEITMIKKRILNPTRIRCIKGSFGFIPHNFLTDGFLASLKQKEILLYFFLILVSDRNGLSYYNYDSICTFLQITVDYYIEAREGLIKKDLIDFDGTVFQVLDLPSGTGTHSPKASQSYKASNTKSTIPTSIGAIFKQIGEQAP
jgi:hypothetical protein